MLDAFAGSFYVAFLRCELTIFHAWICGIQRGKGQLLLDQYHAAGRIMHNAHGNRGHSVLPMQSVCCSAPNHEAHMIALCVLLECLRYIGRFSYVIAHTVTLQRKVLGTWFQACEVHTVQRSLAALWFGRTTDKR